MDGLVWVYDRAAKALRHLHPKVVCRGEDFYSVQPDGLPKDQRIETEILSPIEGLAAPVIRKIEAQAPLNMEECAHLCMFIGLQFSRVPSVARAVSRIYEEQLLQMIRIQFGTAERARVALREVEQLTGKAVDIDPESMVEYVKERFSIKATERPFLESMFHQARSVAELIAQSHWTMLEAPAGSGFITADLAFVSVPPADTNLNKVGAGYGVPGVVNYFPLTRQVCLESRYEGVGIRYRKIDGRCTRIVNRNVAASSDRFIIGGSERQLVSVIEDCCLNTMEYSERFTIEILRESADEGLIKFERQHPPRYFYF